MVRLAREPRCRILTAEAPNAASVPRGVPRVFEAPWMLVARLPASLVLLGETGRAGSGAGDCPQQFAKL